MAKKIISLFEPHTNIIIEKFRNGQYAHKINLATERHGFVTWLKIKERNPADVSLHISVLDACQTDYERIAHAVVADGGHADQANVRGANEQGAKRAVFNKPVGLELHDMG